MRHGVRGKLRLQEILDRADAGKLRGDRRRIAIASEAHSRTRTQDEARKEGRSEG